MNSGSSVALEGHREGVLSVVVLNDAFIVSGSKDGTIRLWDLRKERSTVLEGHRGSVRALAVWPDGRLVSGSKDKSILIWTPSKNDGAPELLFIADAPIRTLTWISPLQLLVAGDESGRLHWLKLRPAQSVAALNR
jgi:WD40 repeat protein